MTDSLYLYKLDVGLSDGNGNTVNNGSTFFNNYRAVLNKIGQIMDENMDISISIKTYLLEKPVTFTYEFTDEALAKTAGCSRYDYEVATSEVINALQEITGASLKSIKEEYNDLVEKNNEALKEYFKEIATADFKAKYLA